MLPQKSATAKAAPSSSSSPLQRVLTDLDTLIRARYPVLYLVTYEEARVEHLLHGIAEQQKKPLYTWSATLGLRLMETSSESAPATAAEHLDPGDLLEHLRTRTDSGLFVLKDFHPFLEDPLVMRRLRECAAALKNSYRTLIIVAPRVNLPPDLEKDITLADIPLPDTAELLALLKSICAPIARRNPNVIKISEGDAIRLAQAAQGLTLSEAENVFARAIVTDTELSVKDLGLVLREKQQIIRKSGILEFYAADTALNDVGGLADLKLWLDQRSHAFSQAAADFGLSAPKGILLLGAPGCGKSLTAKAVASAWKMPLLKLDFGRVFSGLVGSSEENMRRALKVAESVAPAVLWIDEIEKGLAGNLGGSSDGGTASRVFGTFLTWMQEKSAPVFVIATANRIEALPPELLRRGRFDEIFFVDLPSLQCRQEILSIHLKRKKRNPADFSLEAIAEATEGFSGAELEHCLVEALFQAFHAGVPLANAHLLNAAKNTIPLSCTCSDELKRLREWAAHRARNADGKPEQARR